MGARRLWPSWSASGGGSEPFGTVRRLPSVCRHESAAPSVSLRMAIRPVYSLLTLCLCLQFASSWVPGTLTGFPCSVPTRTLLHRFHFATELVHLCRHRFSVASPRLHRHLRLSAQAEGRSVSCVAAGTDSGRSTREQKK